MTNEIEIQHQAPAQRRRPAHRKKPAGVPYAGATSGEKARAEAIKILQRLGCEAVGFMDDFQKHEVFLAFTHRSRKIQLRASANGWAQMWLKKNPYTHRMRHSRADYEQDALRQGRIAINSILRDWVKGSVTAIESGVLSFEAVFMPYMLTNDGRPVIERMQGLLPAPTEEKVVGLPRSAD